MERDGTMKGFYFQNGYLYCENVKVRDICDTLQTPFYLYSRAALEEQYTMLDEAFKDIEHMICYAVKACSNVEVVRLLGKLGSGADIVSGGELYRALNASIEPRKIVYSGVGKTEEEMTFALETGILMFNIESEEELAVLDRVGERLGKKAGVALRINPDVDAHTHEKITTGKKENKFGIPFDQAVGLYQKIERMQNIMTMGIHFHIGSQILKPDPFVAAATRIRKLVLELKNLGIPLTYLNIGGGFGIAYSDEKPKPIKEFWMALAPQIRDLDVTLLMEPGRYIVGNSAVLVTKVLYTKGTPQKKFIIVDSGMNDLIRPALYNSYHAIHCITPNNGKKESVDVVGPICESADFFAHNRKMPVLKSGDFLAVMSAGAYGFSMASNYNSKPRPAEILVEGESHRIIRKRETYSDIIRQEIDR